MHRSRHLWTALLVAALVLPVSLPQAVRGAPLPSEPVPGEDAELYRCKKRTSDVAITFKPEMELHDLVTWVIGFTCKSFMLDPRIVSTGKKVTLMAPAKMSSTEAYGMFLAALSTVGLTVVPKGSGYRIVDSATAKAQALPIYAKGLPDDTDQIVRYVVRPAFAQAETLKQAFLSLKSDAGDIQVIGSLVLVTDYGSQVRTMMTLAKVIDVAKGTDTLYTIPVKHADATKLAEKLEGILDLRSPGPAAGKPGAEVSASGAPVPSKLLVDERTNTLVLAGSEAAYLRVQSLVDRLDVALDIEGGASIHVYHLTSAIADELATVLSRTIEGQGKAKTAGHAPGAAAPAVTEAGSPAIGPTIEGDVRVIGEKASNSLIVLSSGRDFLAIKDVIKQLDRPRRQVYIEGMIVEVQLSNDSEVGISAHGTIPTGSSTGVVVGGVQTGTLRSTDASTLASASGLIGGVLGSALSGSEALFGKSIPSYGILFQALATQTNSNVLSAPSLIALDNEEAKYKIGTNIPYKHNLSYGGLTAAAGATTVNIDRQDLQLELDIKPHISNDDTILLEIKHDAKDLGDTGGELGPTWNTRSLETRVLVRDQQTVVIGGLIQEREYVVKTRVPVLGDLPLIGVLFRHTLKQKKKTNLVILLTPYIIRDQLDLEAIRARKMQQHDEFVRSFRTLDAMKYQPKVDYGRKRGLVEEIHLAVDAVDADRAVLNSVGSPRPVATGAVEINPVVAE